VEAKACSRSFVSHKLIATSYMGMRSGGMVCSLVSSESQTFPEMNCWGLLPGASVETVKASPASGGES
jgi:hypothetical protein